MRIDYRQIAEDLALKQAEAAYCAHGGERAFDQGLVVGRMLFTEGHECPPYPVGKSDEKDHRLGMRCGWIAAREQYMTELQAIANGGQS